jgi:alkylation response protein AidB-like acyl-CoA dehydrogenase
MAAMFTMMNTERLSVGIQGLGIGEAACQAAVWYARERFRADPPPGRSIPTSPPTRSSCTPMCGGC